ncbi:hypothetical protein BDN72DRAFT_850036 [Pluteus cervinus]|uniref:Uncharacterized protein n=1 Tax=Pluteus cervinus TaxID=181527 RepID=A0ACD3A5T3_9AGAR|nr:hypothetical protein BDN72DRAFT_850036 [Pluteus cervinus]
MALSAPPTCNSCCEACCNTLAHSGNPHNESGPSQPSPYALQNLLPVGTVHLSVVNDATPTLCTHNHAEDGWHPFQGSLFLGWLTRLADDALCGELDFLIKNRFLEATYQAYNENTVIIRIYLIPYDLRHVQGKLRIRKDAVLGPARRYLRKLLPLISQSKATWKGSEIEPFHPFMPNEEDSRTLSEIYGDLHSPIPVPPSQEDDIARRLLDFEDDLGGLGMRSTLYRYQRRTVAAMVQREKSTEDIHDPLFVAFKTIKEECFYIQPGTLQILRDCPKVAPTRGGLLCEELGTGKTVMVLGLVLSTLNQLPSPEVSIMDDRPILTPLAFRHFPSDEFHIARQRLYRDSDPPDPFRTSRVPSLVEILLHKMRTDPDITIPNTTTSGGACLFSKKLTLADALDSLPLGKLLQANTPFYHYYSGEPTLQYRTDRKATTPGPRVVYLSPATLIVVPANLISQWDREIQKHCEHPLRVFILRTGTRMPSVHSLASDYDIILMTYNRFTAEDAKKSVNKLHSLKSCECPEYPGYRIPDCKCKNKAGVSPLLQIRWKRLVIDEGHVSASLSTILTPFTKLLSVERRWIVTGTPTTNLLGLSLGGRSAEAEGVPDEDVDMDPTTTRDTLLAEAVTDPTQPEAQRQRRIWTKYDREDLLKLGNMITHFVAVPHLIAEPKLLVTNVIDPLLDANGPRPGSIQVLSQVMEMVMIRHRIEDVEAEVILPPIKHDSILLDLDPFAIKSYNASQATIVINAIDSQRTDQDYMFHPRNTDILQLTVKVMSQIMFWSISEDLYHADQLLQDELLHISTAVERSMPPEDMQLMKDAFRHLHIAAEDPLWRAMQMHEDVPYRVFGVNPLVFEGWSRMPKGEDSDANPTGFIHPDRLIKLRQHVNARPLATIPNLVEEGQLIAEEDIKIRRLYEESLRRKKSERRNKSNRQQDPNVTAKATTAAKRASATETLKEVQKELNTSLARADSEGQEQLSPSPPQPLPIQHNQASSGLVLSSPVITTRIGSSASSKLNYIIKEVLQYSPTEKFLIFSDSELSLAHIAEALELIGVKYLRFTTQVTPQFREQLVLTFETSETFRVFLMELKHGARGLNLISASRVIFCEPVWQADVESQAIKRAHRIGQTKSIHVKTLAIRGTAEENMVARREALRSNQGRLPKLTEEAGMRHFIANPKFIEETPTDLPVINVPLIKPPSAQTQGPSTSPPRIHFDIRSRAPADAGTSDASQRRVSVQGPVISDALPTTDPRPRKKKARAVRFA